MAPMPTIPICMDLIERVGARRRPSTQPPARIVLSPSAILRTSAIKSPDRVIGDVVMVCIRRMRDLHASGPQSRDVDRFETRTDRGHEAKSRQFRDLGFDRAAAKGDQGARRTAWAGGELCHTVFGQIEHFAQRLEKPPQAR